MPSFRSIDGQPISAMTPGVTPLNPVFATGAVGTFTVTFSAFSADVVRETLQAGNAPTASSKLVRETLRTVLQVVLANLTGVNATGAIGAFTETISETLSGIAGTGAVGTIIAAAPTLITLPGVSATGAVGDVTASLPTVAFVRAVHATGVATTPHATISDTLVGVAATGAIGTFSSVVTVPLTGVAGSGHVGTLTRVVLMTLGGVSTIGVAADLSAIPFRWNLDLVAVAATGHAGALAEHLHETLHSVAATGHVGALTQRLQAHLSGVAASGQVGALLGIPQGDGLRMGDFVVTGTVLQTPNVVSLRWSDTRGASWPMNPLDRSLGAEGEYLTTPTWYRLGMARDRIFEIEWATPRATALTGAFIEFEQSND